MVKRIKAINTEVSEDVDSLCDKIDYVTSDLQDLINTINAAEMNESEDEESDLGLYIQTTGELYNKYISGKNKDDVDWDNLLNDGVAGYKEEIEDKEFSDAEKEEAKEYVKNYFFESMNETKLPAKFYIELNDGTNYEFTSKTDAEPVYNAHKDEIKSYYMSVIDPKTKEIIFNRDLHAEKLAESKSVKEDFDEDLFEAIIDYANEQGVNTTDLFESDYEAIADYVSEKLRRPVSAATVEEAIVMDYDDSMDLDEELEYKYDDEISTFKPGSIQYKKLEQAAKMIQDRLGIIVKVDDTWFDYGQRWMWTTLLGEDPDGIIYDDSSAWQLIYPPQQKEIIFGDINKAVDDICKHYEDRLRKNESMNESISIHELNKQITESLD